MTRSTWPQKLAKAALQAPIVAYRYTLSPLLGANCRYVPSCSEYASEAIEKNGAWKGFWLALARLCRCHPLGASGYDPVPDLSAERHPFAPWRYGRWTGRHIAAALEERPRRLRSKQPQRGQSGHPGAQM